MIMLNRRRMLASTAIAGVITPTAACSGRGAMAAYENKAASLRAPLSEDASLMEFVRCATLAANGHNTQPWLFSLNDNGVSIDPDLSRRTPVVDPDDHHLFINLGCAAENFLIAAANHGRHGAVEFDPYGTGRLHIDLVEGQARTDDLYPAIFQRQSTRSEYDGGNVPAEHLRQLKAAAQVDGVTVIFITEKQRRDIVLDHVILGNTLQIENSAFVAELKESIRFNATAATESGDGLFSACSGNPTLPTWLGHRMFDMFFSKASENNKYQKQLNSSAGVAIFLGDRQDKYHWVQVGRAFERFALKATALGIRHAHVNQPVEVPSVRSDFADWLGVGGMLPDLVVRFGYAPALPMSLRRPPADVIVAT